MSLGLLFPGQGTQHAATLPWLDERPEAAAALQSMASAVGADWRARLADTAWATRNAIAQPLLTGLALAAWQCLADKVPRPAVVAGYSVGELAAFAVAGMFDAATAIDLACDRASAMDRVAVTQPIGLLAVAGIAPSTMARACERHGLALAIQISADSVILGGLVSSLAAAEAELGNAGARVSRLAVQVASHTPWMAGAATAFAQRLRSTPLHAPVTTIVCNFSGAASRRPQTLAHCLAAQIAAPVRWDICMDSVAERGVRGVLEVGPGTTLSSMWRARHPRIPVRSIDEFRSVDGIVDWVRNTLRR